MTDDDLDDDADDYIPTVFADPVLQARYLACREQMGRLLGFPRSRTPQREWERWHQVRDAFRERQRELEAQRQHEVPQ
jgi:hypothetical protein